MNRQALVEKRVGSVQQFDRAAIFVNDASEEQFGLFAHGEPQIVVEVRVERGARGPVLQSPQIEPLAGEVGNELFRGRVGEHARDLPLQHGRLVQPVALCQ